jgi:hypothetical protein
MRTYFTLLLLTFFISSCTKDDTGVALSLPAKTQSGQHTFGFLLNSSVWTNYGQVCFLVSGCRDNLTGYYYPNDGDIHIAADKVLYKNGSWNTIENMDLSLKTNFGGLRTYSTLTNDTIGVVYRFSENGQTEKTYRLPTVNPVFNITLTKIDASNKILSGEFSGKLF